MYNMDTAFSKNPYPSDQYIYNFGRLFLIIITKNSVSLTLLYFKEVFQMHFHCITCMATP